jgi:hypothetical protein
MNASKNYGLSLKNRIAKLKNAQKANAQKTMPRKEENFSTPTTYENNYAVFSNGPNVQQIKKTFEKKKGIPTTFNEEGYAEFYNNNNNNTNKKSRRVKSRRHRKTNTRKNYRK